MNMQSSKFFHDWRICLRMPILVLILLVSTEMPCCKAFRSIGTALRILRTTEEHTNVKFSTPKECARDCQNNGPSKYCYYNFTIELYSTVGEACDFCEPPTNGSAISLTCECILGDGFEKTVFSLNRMIPGPSIQVCKGDTVIVDLHNVAEGVEASIHWHGIFQNGYQYYDGVPHITQCPITSGDTFRYNYTVQNSGTHFYHSHISVIMIDGEYGSLIVRDSPMNNPHYSKYDHDLPEHVCLISDLFHEVSLARFPGRYKINIGQTPENFLINGRGQWTGSANSYWTRNVSLSTFTVEQGKRYRFRIINSCSTVCLITLRIENHSMMIIATDGENVEPRSVDAITMATGERVDIILYANQTKSRYWIHVQGLGECEEARIYQLAVLIYKGSSETSLSPKPGYNYTSSESTFNPLNSTDCDINICVDRLKKIYPRDETVVPLNVPSNQNVILSFDFFNYSSTALFSPNAPFERFYVAPDRSHLDGLMRNISFEDPAGALISQRKRQMECKTLNTGPGDPNSCTQVIDVKKDSVVDIMIYDYRPLSDLNHPFHLHGYSFCVLWSGQFADVTTDVITPEDVKKVFTIHTINVRNGNYVHCSPKDTVVVPNTGFVIFRFVANNPGWWFLHCHFLWHTAVGMNVVLHVGDKEDLPPMPTNFPKCYNWPNNIYPT